jgi:hypothetical protein
MVALPRTESQDDPIARVKATVQIGDYAENKMGLKATKRTPNQDWFLCPFHKETTASFHIRDREQDFKCFGCGKGGDVIDLEMAATGEQNARVAAERILAEYGVQPAPAKVRPMRMVERGPLSEGAIAWLNGRGISAAVALRNSVTGENNAITFSYVNEGEVVNQQHRTLSAKGFRFDPGKPVIPFGLDDCEGRAEVVIVEGVMDKLAVEEATGRTAVLAMPSATPSSDCFALAVEACKAASKVIVAVDNDEPGASVDGGAGYGRAAAGGRGVHDRRCVGRYRAVVRRGAGPGGEYRLGEPGSLLHRAAAPTHGHHRHAGKR